MDHDGRTLYRRFASVALHYLALELLFKSVTVIATTQVTVIASSLLLTNYFTAASIIYIVQPWKAVDQGGSIFRLPNALNRMESSNMLLQSLLIVVPVIFGATFGGLVTGLLYFLVIIVMGGQVVLQGTEYLETRKVETTDVEEDAVKARVEVSDRMYDISIEKGRKAAATVTKMKNDIDEQRLKIKAQLEATSEALLLRAEKEPKEGEVDNRDAVLQLAEKIIANTLKLDPLPPVKISLGERLTRALAPAETKAAPPPPMPGDAAEDDVAESGKFTLKGWGGPVRTTVPTTL